MDTAHGQLRSITEPVQIIEGLAVLGGDDVQVGDENGFGDGGAEHGDAVRGVDSEDPVDDDGAPGAGEDEDIADVEARTVVRRRELEIMTVARNRVRSVNKYALGVAVGDAGVGDSERGLGSLAGEAREPVKVGVNHVLGCSGVSTCPSGVAVSSRRMFCSAIVRATRRKKTVVFFWRTEHQWNTKEKANPPGSHRAGFLK